MLPSLSIKDRIRKKLIEDAVKDLQRWMFPKVNEQNIFTDITYSYFFERILNRNKGMNPQIDDVIEEILFELKYTIKDIQ